jgi:hypothetical protein
MSLLSSILDGGSGSVSISTTPFLFSGSSPATIAGTSSNIVLTAGNPIKYTLTANSGVTTAVIAIQAASDVGLTNWVTLGIASFSAAGSENFTSDGRYYAIRANVISLAGGTATVTYGTSDGQLDSSGVYTSPQYSAVPAPARTTLAKCTIPMAIFGAATVNNVAGSVTVTNGLETAVGAFYGYLPAGVTAAGDTAGWYYMEKTGGLAVTIYRNKLAPFQIPFIPTVKTACTAAVVGAFVSYSGTTQYPIAVKLPQGLLSDGSSLLFRANFRQGGAGCSQSLEIATTQGTAGTQIKSIGGATSAGVAYDFKFNVLSSASQQCGALTEANDNINPVGQKLPYTIDLSTQRFFQIGLFNTSSLQACSMDGFTLELI